MRIHRQFGIVGANIVACACSFYLSPAAALAQTNPRPGASEPAPEEETWPGSSIRLSLQQLHDQQRAMLQTIDSINHQTEAGFARYVGTIDSKLDLLQQTFLWDRQQELEALRGSSHLMLALSLGLVGLAILGMVAVALLPVRAMNRLAAGVRASVLAHAGDPARLPAWSGGAFPFSGPGGSEMSGARLQAALDQLEKRLLAMEGLMAPARVEDRAFLKAQPSKSAVAPPRARSALAKPLAGPHVALAMGTGESLFFLPQERQAAKFRWLRNFWPRIKRLAFHRRGKPR